MGSQATRAKRDASKRARKTYKFSEFRDAGQKRAAERDPRPEIPPFVIDDVDPPIEITAPDDVERMFIIADIVGRDLDFNEANSLQLLKALCGEQFDRVWFLVRKDKTPDTIIALVNALLGHFADAIEDLAEAGDQPGGSQDLSD